MINSYCELQIITLAVELLKVLITSLSVLDMLMYAYKLFNYGSAAALDSRPIMRILKSKKKVEHTLIKNY